MWQNVSPWYSTNVLLENNWGCGLHVKQIFEARRTRQVRTGLGGLWMYVLLMVALRTPTVHVLYVHVWNASWEPSIFCAIRIWLPMASHASIYWQHGYWFQSISKTPKNMTSVAIINDHLPKRYPNISFEVKSQEWLVFQIEYAYILK